MRVKEVGQLDVDFEIRGDGGAVVTGDYRGDVNCTCITMRLSVKKALDACWLNRVLQQAASTRGWVENWHKSGSIVLSSIPCDLFGEKLKLVFTFNGQIRSVEGCLRAAARLLEGAVKKVGPPKKT